MPDSILTDARLAQLEPLTPRKRLAVALLWLYEADILDEVDYGVAVARAMHEPIVVDAGEEGGPLC